MRYDEIFGHQIEMEFDNIGGQQWFFDQDRIELENEKTRKILYKFAL